MPDLASAIVFQDVSQTFRTADGQSVLALRDVSFDIRPNELIAVIGPSGCGKSTLLRLAAGLIVPTEGRVIVNGKAVERPGNDVGIVFQKPTLLPWLNIADNVTFPMRHKFGHVTGDDRQRGRELLSLVGLQGFERAMPDELSGGMQQRAAIARALLLKPSILLMDEPFSALDALMREDMSMELQRIWLARPNTVLFITHSISEAVLLANRIIIMSARPGAVQEIVDVPLSRPRTQESLVKEQANEITTRIRRALQKRSPLAA